MVRTFGIPIGWSGPSQYIWPKYISQQRIKMYNFTLNRLKTFLMNYYSITSNLMIKVVYTIYTRYTQVTGIFKNFVQNNSLL